MKIEQFVDEFNKSQNKESCVKAHIVTSYIDFERKIAICSLIAKKMILENGDLVKNTPMVYENFVLSIAREYTDIETSPEESLKAFNLLEQNGVTEYLVSAIGKDAKRLNTILDMTVADTIDNHNNLVNHLSLKSDNMNLIFDKLQTIVGAMSEKTKAPSIMTNA